MTSPPPENVTDVDVLVTREPLTFDVVAGRGTVVVETTNVGARGPVGPTGATGPQGGVGPVGPVGAPGGQWEEVREYTASASNIPTPAGIAGGYVTVISGGAGGGSGRRGAAGSVRCGGGGGSSSAQMDVWLPAANWGATYGVTVGALGAGGAAATVDSTDGNPGVNGGRSAVSTGSVIVDSRDTAAGLGGTATSGAGGVAQGGVGVAGGSASATGGVGSDGGQQAERPGSGGGGGGINSGNAAWRGGYGGVSRSYNYSVPGPGVVDGALPQSGLGFGPGTMSTGSPGGSASATQAAQAGADIILPPAANGGYGGGGGGGGASLNGFASGKGGNGAPGYVRVRFVYNPPAPVPGSGIPEGVFAASVGTMYTDTAATRGAVQWVKSAGTSNTGWRVVYGDTGWRNLTTWDAAGVITGAPLQPGVAPRTGAAGSISIRRVGYITYMKITNLQAGATGLTNGALFYAWADLPAGFFSYDNVVAFGTNGSTSAYFLAALRVQSTGIAGQVQGAASLPASYLFAPGVGLTVAFPCDSSLAWPPVLP